MLKKVFIIDDDEISIFVLESFLAAENFAEKCCGFQDAQEALQVLLEMPEADLPEVIFLDLNMPVLSGWNLLDALQPYQEKFSGRCYFYILTSSVDPAEIERAKEYRLVIDYLHKPLTEEAISRIALQCAHLRKV